MSGSGTLEMSDALSSNAEREFQVGEHRLRFIPPDTIRLWWKGRCSRTDFEGILEWSTRQTGGRPYFVIADLSQLAMIDSDAREFAAKDTREHAIQRVAMLGASFHIRVVVSMVTRAMILFHHEQRGKMRFFDNEAEAQAWLKQERTRLGFDM